MTSLATKNAQYSLQILSNHSVDSNPSLLLIFPDQRYLFNSPEAISRVCIQDKTQLKKVGNVFIGSLESSAGLPGLILTTVEAGNDQVQVIGPQGLDHLVASYRFFTRRERLSLKLTQVPELPYLQTTLPSPIFQDSNISVHSFPVTPTAPYPGSTRISSPPPLKRKRSSPSPPPRPKSPPTTSPHDSTFPIQDKDNQNEPSEALAFSKHDPTQSPPPFDPAILSGREAVSWRQLVIADMFRGKKFITTPPNDSKNGKNSSTPTENSNPTPTPTPIGAWPGPAARVTPSYLLRPLPPLNPVPPAIAVSYLVIGPTLRGKFLPEQAKKLGVKPGKDFSRLTMGERVWVTAGAGEQGKDKSVLVDEKNGGAPKEVGERGKKLSKAERKKRKKEADAKKLEEVKQLEGVGEGHWVAPEDCVEPGMPGNAFLVLDIPTTSHLSVLASSLPVSPLQSLPNATLQTVIYNLGPGVLHSPLLLSFIDSLPKNVTHRFSSPDVKNWNHVTFAPAALLSLRLSLMNPNIFRLPTYDFIPAPPVLPAIDQPIAKSANPGPPTMVKAPDTPHLPSNFPPSSYLLRPTDRLERATTPIHTPLTSHRNFDFVVPSPEADREAAMLKPSASGVAQSQSDEVAKKAEMVWDRYLVAAADAREIVKREEAERKKYDGPGKGLRITPLGTGSAIPSKYRNVSSTLIQLEEEDGGGYILLDAGEGTWGQIARRFGKGERGEDDADMVLRKLRLVTISHMHQDHHAGLSTILRRRAQLSPPAEHSLMVIGPTGVRYYLHEQQQLFDLGLGSLEPGQGAVKFVDSHYLEKDGKSFPQSLRHEITEMCHSLNLKDVTTVQVLHRCKCWGVAIESNSGWKVVFSGDTMPCDRLVEAGKGATLLIHEATIEDELPEVAHAKGHSTFGQAIDIAKRMKAEYCLLTHFSARYPKLPPLNHDGDDNQGPIVAVAFDLATMYLDEFWKMERYREAMDVLFGDGEEEKDELHGASMDEGAGEPDTHSACRREQLVRTHHAATISLSQNDTFLTISDEEVVSEMRKMTAFIKQEALEKAREIKVKADEEFAIEKGKIVRQESTNIDAAFERKKKQLEIEKKIEISNQNNKSRLQLLEAREEYLEKVFEEARGKLKDTTSDEGKYGELLKGLILQALFTIMEKDITVSGRKVDSKFLKTAAAAAAKEFEAQAGFAVKLEVKEDLPKESAGGVTISGYGNRITVNNTLDERLRLLEERMLPEIRESLFGKNENRKFYS
ncbi:hypothetical protein T439DRAFT_355163 [Meredithblackwellia eburnea MCA 4105]